MTDDYRKPEEILDPWDRLRRLKPRLERGMAHPTPHQFDIIHATFADLILEIDQRLKIAESNADWSKDQIVAERRKPKGP
jgi:hypothetical protein